jgi:inner membrane protein
VFALVAGGVAAALFSTRAWRVALLVAVVVGSHGMLDALTDGGLGAALLWPFDENRYFAPWTPIPVSPIGLRVLSPYGLSVALYELVLFSPLLAYALWPRRGLAPASVRPPSSRTDHNA